MSKTFKQLTDSDYLWSSRVELTGEKTFNVTLTKYKIWGVGACYGRANVAYIKNNEDKILMVKDWNSQSILNNDDGIFYYTDKEQCLSEVNEEIFDIADTNGWNVSSISPQITEVLA